MATGCAPGCRKPPYCGDGKMDGSFGEQCDDGSENGTGLCDVDCKSIIP